MPTAAPPSEPASTTDRRWQRAWHRVLPPTPAVPDQNHQLSQQLPSRNNRPSCNARPSGNGETSNSETNENSATGRAVDAVYDALWASRGQPAPATQLIPSPQVRLARVRMLTQWNDHPDRTRSEVMTVVDRAISATIMSLLATPRQAAHSRQSATPS